MARPTSQPPDPPDPRLDRPSLSRLRRQALPRALDSDDLLMKPQQAYRNKRASPAQKESRCKLIMSRCTALVWSIRYTTEPPSEGEPHFVRVCFGPQRAGSRWAYQVKSFEKEGASELPDSGWEVLALLGVPTQTEEEELRLFGSSPPPAAQRHRLLDDIVEAAADEIAESLRALDEDLSSEQASGDESSDDAKPRTRRASKRCSVSL